MAGANIQYLEVDDFSGGMTDYYLQGDKKRYQFAKNYLINVDRKLESRPGSRGFDTHGNHKLPAKLRIGSFLHYDNESELLVQQARKIYYLNSTPAWTEIIGPSGNEAIAGATDQTSFSYAEWKQHIYYTNSGEGLPGKIYRDETSTFQTRTVGLPFANPAPKYSDASLLAKCINLANEIRASMYSHMNNTVLHDSADKWSLSYFATQSAWSMDFDPEYPGPQPVPTPALAASDETTLYALIRAMSLAYEHHGADLAVAKQYYHAALQISKASGGASDPPKGPFQLLKNNTTPSDLEVASAQLDELKQKWNWHRLGVFSHSATNSFTAMDAYPVTHDSIGVIDTIGVPQFLPDDSDFLRYVNYFKHLYNIHVSNASYGADWSGINNDPGNQSWHTRKNDPLYNMLCTLPDAHDRDSAYLIIYWIWAIYGQLHVADSNFGVHKCVTFDTTANSADVINVADADGAVILPVGSYVVSLDQIFSDIDALNRRAAKVTASASGTATFSKPLIADDTDVTGQYSSSDYHGAYLTGALITSNTVSLAAADEFLDPQPTSGISSVNNNLPTTHEAWIALAQTVFTSLALHASNAGTHAAAQSVSAYLAGNGPFFLPQIATYAYAVVYAYTYKTKNTVEFLNVGPPVFFGSFDTGKQYPPGTQLATGFPNETDYPVTDRSVASPATGVISNLPVLVNDNVTNYDTSEIKVLLYRTQDGGNTYYLLDSLDNGATSYSDFAGDQYAINGGAALVDRETLYTTGGVVANDPPPQSKFIYILQNTAYYGYVSDGGQFFPNRILQSVPGSPDAVPGDFFDDLDDELVGLSAARNNLIALCQTHIYRMSGGYNNQGQGTLLHESISDSIGCISSRSIVQTEIGVFFAGTDGFYYTDGFQLIKVSIDLDATYLQRTLTLAQRERIHGSYDRLTRRVWWTMQSEATAAGCDEAFIYYLNYGVKPSGVFTTADNGTHFQPSAFTFFKGTMYRGDERGLIFKHKDTYKSDPKVPDDLNTALSAWENVYIPWKYRSCALDFGTIAKGTYVTKLHFLGKNVGNVNVQANAIADNNYFSPSNKPLAPMIYRKNKMWDQAKDADWSDDDFYWKYDGKFDEWRRFPSGNLRAQFKQIEFVPARVGIYSYDEFPKFSFCDVELDILTATLLTPGGYTGIYWPKDVVDMYIAFENDDYDAEYLITSVSHPDPDNAIEVQETPSGTINGSNVTFTLANTPVSNAAVSIFQNGIFMRQGTDYSISGTTLTMTVAPVVGQQLDAVVFTLSANTNYQQAPTGTIDGVNTTYTLAHRPTSNSSLKLYQDGLLLRQNSDYTVDNVTITMIVPTASGQTLDAVYVYGSDVSRAIQDILAGDQDGVNTVFHLSHNPITSGTVKIYSDGLFFRQGVDYTISGKVVTFTNAPTDEQLLDAAYSYGTGTGIVFTNPDGDLTTDLYGQKWVIRGYQKEAGLSMLGYVLHYAFLGERGDMFTSGSGAGENV